MKLSKTLLVASFALALVACGSGSGNGNSSNTSGTSSGDNGSTPSSGIGSGNGSGTSTSTNKISGVVMDGYLSNTLVFLDLNDNGTFDNGEPSATTDSNGAYTLDATPDQLANHSIVAAVAAGSSMDQDNPSAVISHSYSLSAPKGKTTITPLSTHIKTKIAAGSSESTAVTDIQQQLGLSNSDVTSDYIASSDLNTHKIAAAIVPVLQAVKAKRDDTPDMTYLGEQQLIDSNIQSLVSSRKNSVMNQSSVSDAARQLSDLILKQIPTLTCVSPIHNTTTSNPNNAVFAIDASGSGTFAASFTVPAGKTQLNQIRLNVNDQQVAKYFQIKIFQGVSIGGTPLFTSDQIYFLNPNRNPRNASGGFRDTTFDVNITVTPGQQYLIQIIGGGDRLDPGGNSTAGIVIADPANGDRIYLGGTQWGTAALAADFCYN